jgi:hypothetical protein
MRLELETIRRLIQSQGGTLEVHYNIDEGQKIIILLPAENARIYENVKNVYMLSMYRENPITNQGS